MGIRNLDNGRLKVKFSGMLLAAARRMIQRDREDQIGDANETNRPDEAYQLRWSAWGMWWGKIRRSFCPPLQICYGGPVLEVKKQRARDTFKSLDRATTHFILAYAFLTFLNVVLLPEESHLQFPLAAGPTAIMSVAIRFHWKKWRGAGIPESLYIDDDVKYGKELDHWIGFLWDGSFSPSQAMLRSALEAISVMLMYLIPVYVTLQFSAAQSASAEVTWSGVLMRYTFAALLTFLFVHIRKANRNAGDIFQEERSALKSVSTLVSA